MDDKESAAARLREVLPFLMEAVIDAKSDGSRAKLAVIQERANGTGKLTARFDSEEFMDDLITLLGEPSSEDKAYAKLVREMHHGRLR